MHDVDIAAYMARSAVMSQGNIGKFYNVTATLHLPPFLKSTTLSFNLKTNSALFDDCCWLRMQFSTCECVAVIIRRMPYGIISCFVNSGQCLSASTAVSLYVHCADFLLVFLSGFRALTLLVVARKSIWPVKIK